MKRGRKPKNSSAGEKIDLPEKLVVITDPPRSGMHEKTIEQLKRLKPRVIIYVSCNPDQLGKDLPKFKQYTVKSVALFDLFPPGPSAGLPPQSPSS